MCKARSIRSPPLKSKSEAKEEKKPKKQTQIKCTFEGCVGCYICKKEAQRHQTLAENEEGFSTPTKEPAGLITPGKTFADALIASFSNKKINMVADYVAPASDQKSNASQTSQTEDVTQSDKTIDNPIGEVPLDVEKNKNKKMRWSGEETEEVIRCFYLAKLKGLKKVKGTFAIWQERNPEIHLNICEAKLNNQLNRLLDKLSKDELAKFEREAKPSTDIKPSSISTINEKEEQDTKESNINMELQKLVDKYMVEIRVKYNEELSKDLINRTIPNKLSYCKENKHKIAAANIVLKELSEELQDELEDCTKLNTMIYVTAIVIAGKPTPPSTPPTKKKNEHSTSSLKKVNRAVGRQPQNKFREIEIGI